MIIDDQDYSTYNTGPVRGGDAEMWARRRWRQSVGFQTFLLMGSDVPLADSEYFGEHPVRLDSVEAASLCDTCDTLPDLCESMTDTAKADYDEYVRDSRRRAKDNYKWNNEGFI